MNFSLPLMVGGALCSAVVILGPSTPPTADGPTLPKRIEVPAPVASAPSFEPIERRYPLEDVPFFGDAEMIVRIVPLDSDGAPIDGASAGGGPNSPDGDNGGGDAFCCKTFDPLSCEPQPGVYSSGDPISLNFYWTESLPEDIGANWFVDVSFWLRLPAGYRFDLIDDPALDFGDLSSAAGTDLGFCVSILTQIPTVPGLNYSPVEQVFSAYSIQGGFPRSTVASFSVN